MLHKLKLSYYSSIILDSFSFLLFPKLCWHIGLTPNCDQKISPCISSRVLCELTAMLLWYPHHLYDWVYMDILVCVCVLCVSVYVYVCVCVCVCVSHTFSNPDGSCQQSLAPWAGRFWSNQPNNSFLDVLCQAFEQHVPIISAYVLSV